MEISLASSIWNRAAVLWIVLYSEWPWCWKYWRREGTGTTEDEMVGWHHWLYGHEFEPAPGAGDGQASLECCSPWGHKELDMTERLNWLTDWLTVNTGSLISLWDPDFNSCGWIPRSRIARSYDWNFNFLRNHCTVFHSSCSILHFHHWRTGFSSQTCKYLLPLVSLMIAILTRMRWHLIVVLICIFLMISDTEFFFHMPFGHLYVSLGKYVF